MRSLGLVFVLVFVSWTLASAAVLYSVKHAHDERDVLIEFVCVAIEINQLDPKVAAEYRLRFGEILARMGEECPQPGR